MSFFRCPLCGSSNLFLSLQKEPKAEKMDSEAVGDTAGNEQNKMQETAGQTPETPINHDINDKNKAVKGESEAKVTKGAIDKELLQACYCCLTNLLTFSCDVLNFDLFSWSRLSGFLTGIALDTLG